MLAAGSVLLPPRPARPRAIGETGQPTSDNRYPVPLGRMIYADAQAPGRVRDVARARRSADFLIQHMTGVDSYGLFFKSSVNSQGVETPSCRGSVGPARALPRGLGGR